jgi:hypothetical protein
MTIIPHPRFSNAGSHTEHWWRCSKYLENVLEHASFLQTGQQTNSLFYGTTNAYSANSNCTQVRFNNVKDYGCGKLSLIDARLWQIGNLQFR